MKLQNKVILTYTILISCSLLIVSLMATLTFRSALSSVTSNLSTQLFSSKSYEISSWLESRVSELRIIAKSECVREMDIEPLMKYIDDLNTTIGTEYGNPWGTFAIGSTDGIGYVGINQTIDISKRSYFIEGCTTDKDYLLSSPVISKTDNSVISILHYPLKNKQGNYGFINAAINLHHLTRIVSDIEFYEGESFIMDTDANLYTNTNAISSNDAKTVLNNLNHHHETTKSFTSGTFTYYYTKIPAAENWYLCTRVNSFNLIKEVSNFIFLLSLLLVSITIITIVVCIYLARSITQPISRLNTTIQNASSNLQIVAEHSSIHEINSLSKSFNHLINKISQLLIQVKEDARKQRQSEIKILQAQINPHFLYNTLDALNWKAFQYQDEEMSTLIHSLCDFYRISLSDGEEFIPIASEIKHVECYLKIQSIRFKTLFTYTIEVEETLLSQICLKVLLQPLVENAITHGLKPLEQGGIIQICAAAVDDTIVFTVKDNGIGMDERTLNEVRNGLTDHALHKYGLYNVNQRIRLTHGEAYGITIHSQVNQGTEITVKIPKMNIEM